MPSGVKMSQSWCSSLICRPFTPPAALISSAANGATTVAPRPLTMARRPGVQFLSFIAFSSSVHLSVQSACHSPSSGAAAVGRVRRRHVECWISVEKAERLQEESAVHGGRHRVILRPDNMVVAEGMPDGDWPIGDRTILFGPSREALARRALVHVVARGPAFIGPRRSDPNVVGDKAGALRHLAAGRHRRA